MQRPLLIFPRASSSEKDSVNRFPPKKPVLPSKERQAERLSPRFTRLEQAFENQRVLLQSDMTGAMPEQALVLETVDTIDKFINAVKKIDGLDWLTEWETELVPDDDFYIEEDGERTEKRLGGRLFLIMSDQQALQQLKSLWSKFLNNERLPHGLGRWGGMFQHLKDIRLWNITDRFRDTGFVEELHERISAGETKIRFEVELWYRSAENKRKMVTEKFKELIQQAGGKVFSECVIPEIAYHAILAEAPVEVFQDLTEHTEVQFLRSEHVMFFRPVGQALITIPEGEPVVEEFGDLESPQKLEPLVALLDGLPLENHDLLRNRLIVDDPDNFQDSYEAHERIHGTAMASLIIHGELDDKLSPISRPLYVRPIMKPDLRDWLNNPRIECIPDDVLPIDLIHRAIRRMFVGDGTEGPVAPTVKIVNLSIGDAARPFGFAVSPWARLLDWLSYEYNVLFIVSAGNYTEGITLEIDCDVKQLTDEQLSEEVLRNVYRNAQHRRILTPSESINALTVGALHEDSSNISNLGLRKDIMRIKPMLSPISRLGLGHRRSIKPDIVMKGGRQLYGDDVFRRSHFVINRSTIAPGQKVAYPGQQGNTSSFAYTRGTSNSTALTTRLAHELCEMLYTLKQTQPDGEQLSDELIPVMIKALIVHGASWRDIYETIERILGSESSRIRDRVIPRLFGYGLVEPRRVFECTEQRVTLFGCNKLTKDRAHIYTVPLPPSLSSKKEWRRLTITLAWFSPVNNNSQKYRQAQLWFDPPAHKLGLYRTEADAKAVKRGTVQHEILEGDQATPFIDGDFLEIKVNCREDAGGLKSEVPYGLVVSLEVAEGVDIQVYEEVRNLIRPRVQIQPHTDQEL